MNDCCGEEVLTRKDSNEKERREKGDLKRMGNYWLRRNAKEREKERQGLQENRMCIGGQEVLNKKKSKKVNEEASSLSK